jgi:hypothetical protein
MNKKVILKWLDEIVDRKPKTFQEFFYEDIRDFIVDEKVEFDKMDLLLKCTSKEEVEKWLNDVCQYITMNLDIDLLLSNYFN